MMQPDQQASIAAQLAALPNTPMKALWLLWDEHFPRRPSHRNRNYVESRLAYRIQELAYGALPTNIRKMLVEAGAKHSQIKSAAGRSAQTLLMPGTTLAGLNADCSTSAKKFSGLRLSSITPTSISG